jgi:hypothetical protein
MATVDARELSAEKRALLEQRLRGSRPAATPTAPRRTGPAPLSPAQEQLWYFTRLAPENPIYNEAVSIRKDGPLDASALSAALGEIIARHEIWRSTVHEVDGEPVQVVAPPPTLELSVVDIGTLATAQEREREAVRLVAERASKPYDLEHGPLLRPLLIRFAEDHHRLYLCMHHLIFDGVSLYRIILPELVTLYNDFAAGRAPSLPAPAVQYADYAVELQTRGTAYRLSLSRVITRGLLVAPTAAPSSACASPRSSPMGCVLSATVTGPRCSRSWLPLSRCCCSDIPSRTTLSSGPSLTCAIAVSSKGWSVIA